VSVRIILFTGKGGVGKTTTAAGTAALAARSGLRTLVLSTDAAHSLGDAFGLPLGGEPVLVAPNLSLHQVDAQRRFERSWGEIQGYLMSVLDAAGVDPITAEELTVIPGAEEVLALLELRNHVVSGEWDVVIVDCAPTAETLRLLALPEALNWYMTRMFGVQRRVVKALRPMLTRAAGVPMPEDAVFDAIERLHSDLEQVQQILTEKDATVRLVLTPETVVVAEARRSMTTLSLYGYRVDGVIANRVFPEGSGDSWREGWVASQQAVLDEVRESFVDLPIWLSQYSSGEPVGVDRLAGFAEAAYGAHDPLAVPTGEGPMTITRTDTGAVLRIALPIARRTDVDLARHGDELVVTVGSYRRLLALPAALSRHTVSGARVEDGSLQVRFRFEQEEQP
jgi:arsenite-transporting ATPase